MIYQLRYDRRFRQHLDALPDDVRAAARQIIADLTHDPRPNQAKELEGHTGFYRLWVTTHPSFLRKQESIWKTCIDRQRGGSPPSQGRTVGHPDGFLLSQE